MTNQNYLSLYAKSFNWAGFFLPKYTYQKCSALYDFCRVADNIADNINSVDIKKSKFTEFKDNFNQRNFKDPIIENMWNLINEFNIPLKAVQDLLDGIKSDINEKVKINTKKELLIYSYRVAGTVGLMMAKILKVKKQNALKAAINLGIAMQLTNIARDVAEDNKKNRKYISSNFESIKSTLMSAESFYKSSFLSIGDIPISCRFAILVARRVYRQIGNNILSKKNIENYNNSGKIYVSSVEKFFQTLLSIYDFFVLLIASSKEHGKEAEHQIINEEINLNERI